MSLPSMKELIPILQMAIGPVILISGVGLLLLSMTNRMGRVIDRSRTLIREMTAPGADKGCIRSQIHILVKRANLLRFSIIMASLSVTLASILIVTLFLSGLFGIDAPWMIALLFIACMVCVVGSLVAFIWDINQTLLALKLEMGEKLNKQD